MGTSEGAKKQWEKRSKEERLRITQKGREAAYKNKSTQKYWNNISEEEKKLRMRPAIEASKRSFVQKRILRNDKKENSQNKISKGTEEYRKKISASQKIVNQDPKVKARKSLAQKAAWSKLSSEEKRKRTLPGNIARTANAQILKPSSIEIKIGNVLKKYNIQYEIQKKMNKWIADIYIPSQRLIIECDGRYWHSLPHRIKRDENFDDWCFKNNYYVIHLKEDDINKDPEQTLINALISLRGKISGK